MVGLHRAESPCRVLRAAPKPLGRAHNFGAQRRSYSGLYLGKPSQSRYANGVPLKSCAVRPSVLLPMSGHLRRQSCRPALLSGFLRGYCHAARCRYLRHLNCRLCPPHPLCHPNSRKPQANKGKKKGRLLRLPCCPHPALGIGNRPARYTAYPPKAYH